MTENMQPAPGLRAIVVGAGVAGLTTAASALHHFDRVLLVDKDMLLGASVASETIEESERRRSGVRQFTQPHFLMGSAAKVMEALLPGFKKDCEARGARRFDTVAGVRFFDFGGEMPRDPVGLETCAVSRRLLSELLQGRLIACGPHLTIRDKTKVAGLLWGEGNQGIDGVVLSTGEELHADFVFMADGRKSHLPIWLRDAGVQLPKPLVVDTKISEANRWMRLPDDFDYDKEFHFAATFGRPDSSRAGFAACAEDRLVQISLVGACGDRPPLDEAGWQSFAASLQDPLIYDTIQRCEAVTPGVPNVQHQYHKVELPKGLVVTGDSMMALNPIYGQGMSVAAMGAVVLDRCMATLLAATNSVDSRREAVRAMGPYLQLELHKQAAVAWNLATSEDLRWPGVHAQGVTPPPSILRMYMDSLFVAGQRDPKVWSAMSCVAQSEAPPSTLFSLRMVGSAVAQMLRDALGGKRERRATGAAAAGSGGGEAHAAAGS